MLKEFKEFIQRGSVMDLAVGVIIGGAFSKIVTSLVNDIIMPLIGLMTGGMNFNDLFICLNGGSFKTLKEAQEAGAATLNYGMFINAIIDFIIIAFVIFLIVKAMNRLRRKKENAEITTKTCPFCKTEIPLEAKRCPHCTSNLE